MADDDKKLYQMLGRMEGKIDAMVAAQAVSNERAKELDVRVRGLEAFRSRALGAASVVGGTLVAALVWLWQQMIDIGGSA